MTVGHRFDIGIVGAGPVGSYTAWRLARLGFSVALLEEHSEAGRPEQCAGLVNRGMFELPGLHGILEDVGLHDITGADIFSPSGKILPLRAGKVKAVSIDRALFDKTLFIQAASSGAELFPSSKVTSVRTLQGTHELSFDGINGKGSMKVDMLIGSDGAASTIRRIMGFEKPLSVIPGAAIQVEVDAGSVPDDLVAVFTGERTAKGFFAWAVPAGSKTTMRIGLASETGAHLQRGLRSLFSDHRIFSWLGLENGSTCNLDPISWNFGPVPMGSPKTIIKERTVILGDASGMAKPTSGGGIYPGLMASDKLASSIEEKGEPDQ
ncbi:MAG: geranylgeranyl reductase family protein, partial [Thermoplasmatota archaeon]